MNIEKAIENLKGIKSAHFATVTKETTETVEKIVIEDLESIDLAISALEKQLNGGWIPVSERLPSEEECNKFDILHPNRRKFYCTIKIGDYEPQVRELYFNMFYQWEYYSENYDKYVTAWQPLPPAYKEVENE